MDVYPDFAALASTEDASAWRIVTRRGAAPGLHLAIHGGSIEVGTGEMALAVAQRCNASAYVFQGLLSRDNRRLHITSTGFDEPGAMAIVAQADPVYSWHGYGDDQARTLIGGRDEDRGRRLLNGLQHAGFDARWAADCEPSLTGRSARNIVNRGAGGAGVQVEMSAGQRRRFFADGLLRRDGELTAEFARFLEAVSAGIMQTQSTVENEQHDRR